MRLTPQAWWCGNCQTKNSPADAKCVKCSHTRLERHAQIHAADRAVVYYNPATGEHRTPARADMPMPSHYEQQGFVRQEIMSMTAYEKETGLIHEASNFCSGNESVPERYNIPKPSPEDIQELAKDMADAIASGPWTGQEKLLDSTV